MAELKFQGPNELTMAQREEMRARQDAFIDSPQISGWRAAYGDEWPIHGTDGPTIGDLKQELYPSEQTFIACCLAKWGLTPK